MKEVLIMNLTRMGDLVQTTPVMAGLKERYPGVRITLFVNSLFAAVCRLIPLADRVIEFDMAAQAGMLRDGQTSLVACYRTLESVLSQVNTVEYDLVLNFTHSNESAVLASLVRGKEVRGITAGAEGERVIRHPWQRYFFQVVSSRTYNPFHLSDIYIRAAGVAPRSRGYVLVPPEEARERVGAMLREAGAAEDEPLVAFQLGASHPLKQWPASSFAKAANILSATAGVRPVLIGAAEEIPLGEEFERRFAGRAANLIGRTSLGDLAELLRRCRLLVSNDTGPLHFATAVGVPVIDISLGHVFFRETGPYGEGHYVVEARLPCAPCHFHLECTDPICKSAVRPEAVAELAARILRGEAPQRLEEDPVWEGVSIFRSGFSSEGFLEYRPLLRDPLREDTLWSCLFRRTWPVILDAKAPLRAGQERARLVFLLVDRHGEGALPAAATIFEEALCPLRTVRLLAEEAARRAALVEREARKPSPDGVFLGGIFDRVPEIDRQIEKVARAHPFLLSPVTFFLYGKEAIDGKDLAEMAGRAREIYDELACHLALLEGVAESLIAFVRAQPGGGAGWRESGGCGRDFPMEVR